MPDQIRAGLLLLSASSHRDKQCSGDAQDAAPSASPASALSTLEVLPRAEVASVARTITRASTRSTHDHARAALTIARASTLGTHCTRHEKRLHARKMTDPDNVQEGQQSMRAGMEPMTAAENLFWQNLEAGAPGIGFSRAEELAHLFFLRAKSHVAAVKVDVPNSLRWEGLIPDAQQLGEWSREGTLAKNIARKPPQHDRAEADLEQDLRKHIVVSEAVLWAFHKGKVHTEKDFLEKDLSGVLPPSVWLNVREARKWYRKTTMIRTLDAAGRMCVIFAYRCDINRASAEDTKAAVSQNTDRHTQRRSQNTDTG